MPSKKSKKPVRNKKRAVRSSSVASSYIFWPLLILSLIMWVIYRTIFRDFPIWFDETIGKAIFFGMPVWMYVTMTGEKSVLETLSVERMQSGLLKGLAYGGIFGFVGVLISLLASGHGVVSAFVFTGDRFWTEFFLALMTGFWESIFFFSFVMVTVTKIYKNMSLLNQILLVSLIWILFHVPALVSNFTDFTIIKYVIFIWLFGVGQAFVFAKEKNAYTLMLIQAIWGMVLLLYAG